jgi:hypothetical protein
MKPVHYLLVAAFALVIGCQAKETITAEGSGDKEAPATTGNPVDDGAGNPDLDLGATTGGQPTLGGSDAGALGATTAKPTEDKPKTGEAANDPGVTMQTLVGDYDGKIFEETIAFLLSMAPAEKRAEAEKELRGAVIKLNLAKDGNYTMTTKSKDKTETNKGTWSYDAAKGTTTLGAPEMTAEQKARLKSQGITDEQLAAQQKQSIVCAVSDGGKKLVFEETQGGMKNGITFTKK